MQYPTKETHPYLIGDSSKDDLSNWVRWMLNSQFLVLREGETLRDAVADTSRGVVCSYLTNPRSMARRQMPMALDFLLLDKEEQEEVASAGREQKTS